jgi:hypothetical protein
MRASVASKYDAVAVDPVGSVAPPPRRITRSPIEPGVLPPRGVLLPVAT